MTITYGPVGTLPSASGTGTSGTTGTSRTSGTTSKSDASTKDQNAVDQDVFLKLLVAQLKYQDPSNPTDPAQFLSQTAQFTTVEKLNQLTTTTQQVFDASRQQTAASLMGGTVTWTDVSGKAHTGTVTGVSLGASTPNLTVDGTLVSLDAVSSVGTMAPPATATTGSSGSGSSGSTDTSGSGAASS